MQTFNATPRVRVPTTAGADEVISIRTLLTHPMHSGQMTDAAGNRIPRHIVNRFRCTFDGEPVLEMDLQTSFAANPYIEFSARVPASGTFEFEWHDDNGDIYTATAEISVG